MKKDLPSMYKQNINKKFNNNSAVFSTLNNDEEDISIRHSTIKDVKEYSKYEVEKKIYEIFNSPDYIYKADVTIITDKEVLVKRIVGKTGNQLITFDNEKIDIDTIRDIYKN